MQQQPSTPPPHSGKHGGLLNYDSSPPLNHDGLPPRLAGMEVRQRQICAVAAALRHGAAPSTMAASTPTEVMLQSGSGGGRLRFVLVADLGGVTSTCSDGGRLLLPLCMTDGGLLPRCMDLGLGSDPG
jgi:hypothetical protein